MFNKTCRGEIMKKEKSKFAPKNVKCGHSTKTKNRGGRPKLDIDEDSVLKLAQLGMTDVEICNFYDISQCVLQRFRGILKKGRSNLSQSIKRTQLEVALKERDKTMLIWVGKQYCGQKEKQDVEHTGQVSSPQVVFYGDRPPQEWKND